MVNDCVTHRSQFLLVLVLFSIKGSPLRTFVQVKLVKYQVLEHGVCSVVCLLLKHENALFRGSIVFNPSVFRIHSASAHSEGSSLRIKAHGKRHELQIIEI